MKSARCVGRWLVWNVFVVWYGFLGGWLLFEASGRCMFSETSDGEGVGEGGGQGSQDVYHVALWRGPGSPWPEWCEEVSGAATPETAVRLVMQQYKASPVFKAAVHGCGCRERWIRVCLASTGLSFEQHFCSVVFPDEMLSGV